MNAYMRGRRAAREVLETGCIVMLAMAAELTVRITPLPVLCRWFATPLEAAGTERATPRPLPRSAERSIRCTERVMRRWPVDGHCLRRSLVLGSRLRRLGPQLRMGVRHRDGRTEMHAWLVVHGQEIGQGEYVRFDVPASRRR